MSIHETIEFDNSGQPVKNPIFRKVFLPLCVLLIGLLGYGLGRMDAGRARPPVEIRYDTGLTQASVGERQAIDTAVSPMDKDSVYASTKGTKYYYSNCKSTISAANKITFESASLAESAGYSLASGCKKP